MSERDKAFMETPRQGRDKRPVGERLGDYREIYLEPAPASVEAQARRCMDCGIPFCQTSGCPVTNVIPEFNEMVALGLWEKACAVLHSMCSFPEFTGRLCPAPCEAACTLSVALEPVTIREIEWGISERGWREGLIRPIPPAARSGRRVAVVGSGPAGLVAADKLNRAGHAVTVFEAADRLGGFLRYGVPDFKMEKSVIDRRLALMRAEGIEFQTSACVGKDIAPDYLTRQFDAICLCVGSRQARELPIPGRQLRGVHLAMEFLEQNNRRVAGDSIDPATAIWAEGKVVVVLGGGDTGSDCIGTANRQGARAVHQFEILPMPPRERTAEMPWPTYPRLLRSSSSQEEGCLRRWNIQTLAFEGDAEGQVRRLRGCEARWTEVEGRAAPVQVEGSEFTLDVDLVLLALGFVRPDLTPLAGGLDLALDERGNIRVDGDYRTSVDKVFAAGDATRGATLIVTAMSAGREMAARVDRYLKERPR